MNMRAWRTRVAGCMLGIVFVMSTSLAIAGAATTDAPGDFSLQITPSPLVTTVVPGKTSSVELKIHNNGSQTEKLKVEPRSFKLSSDSANVTLNDTTPPDISQWISFSAQTFTIKPGQWFSEQVSFTLPKDTGFSYSFALVISRQSEPSPTNGGRLIKGSVAVFTLVNVDRAGATRKLDVAALKTDHHIYEFLPANLSVVLKNSGNTIVQPYGNIFIGRGSSDKKPLAVLPVNDQRGYILPGTERTLKAVWDNGFPTFVTTTTPDGTKHSLHTDWSKLSNFRIGRYTANLVAAYDDGQGHDVPIQGQVSFWVIPWRSILILLLVLTGLWYLQHWRQKRKTEKAVRRALAAQKAAAKEEHDHA